uniref:PKS-NRPS hybrid n=2 Tax=Colletotrichum higginsianum TaxID=80884 RepID=I1UYF3_9PEZI|nr:PKS-NRPS hybrid [Colletotrichum higginsianum]
MFNKQEPIAIIGTGCRFPGGSDSPSKLWELLKDPRDLLKEIPEDRFSVEGFYHPKNSHHGTTNVRHSYLLDEDLRRFDASFFGIKATEANSIDPQQRMLMETVYEGLESAGLSIKQLQGSDTAVYVGVMSADYTEMLARDVEKYPTYFATGTARSILSNRLSYAFDWRGPSMTIDTACSSSLIAMHQAVQALRSGESKVAIAAGTNLLLGPEQYIAESKLQMLSPSGRSRMWDADADGYARGEGVAAIVMKPLSQALADGDSIECVIRETGLNQDGKTPGITMPSSSAQAALIRSTYARAGLDLSKPSDRPQFFEAHGTGTPAGDPIEAAAIREAFFGADSHFVPRGPDDTLYVGSIKTVIGHTEGTAGLAAVVKATEALKAATLPPNRLFNRLSPKVEPFYKNLEVVTSARPWPKIPANGMRRVSVNSFGFGGANCHAILESADAYKAGEPAPRIADAPSFAPYVVSAATESALASSLERLRDHLQNQLAKGVADISMRDLAWTLYNRRSTLACRTVVPAARSLEDLVNKLDDSIRVNEGSSDSSNTIKARTSTAPLRVLGVFTGQGAQWPRMGAELIEDSPAVGDIIRRLDESLQTLPVPHRPSWSIRDQLLAPSESSKVDLATLSQPLCTALQVVLVDLLKAAGVQFSAVVGHSSGEIGAAYAAGYLSAKDAIRVAYYRGFHLESVTQKGAMLAVGTSFEDAEELCSLPAFEGRVCVAASNSSSSVTLSGDADAIDEVKIILDEEKKFNRLLRVDRAYHSHHMKACSQAYMRSLELCGIRQLRPVNAAGNCRWVSSVFTCDVSDMPTSTSLESSYWIDNLVKPVRFTEALQMLVSDGMNSETQTGGYDLALEVGPHPALKGPASQTIQETTSASAMPFTGALERGKNSVEAFSRALGFVWMNFGEGSVNMAGYEGFVTGDQAGAGSKPSFNLVKGLPKYPWDHNRLFWQESRLSKAYRSRKDAPHELLGRRLLDGTPDQRRWRNIIKKSEIDWLDGHQIQGQVVFPAAAYVSACIEACMCAFSADENVRSIELLDFDVGHAMVFEEDDDDGIDATISLVGISRTESTTTCRFSFYSTPTNDALEMVTHATCNVVVTFGDEAHNLLPPKPQDDDDYLLLDVEEDRFYDALAPLGFGYNGPFRALQGLKRKLGSAKGFIQNPIPSPEGLQTPLLIHPATLDSAIQSIMLAYSYPGDTMLRSVYLPTRIERLIVSPQRCLEFAGKSVTVPFDSVAMIGSSKSVTGDASIYTPQGFDTKAIQLEGLQTRPLSDAAQLDELNIFTEAVWGVDRPDSEMAIAMTEVEPLDPEFFFSLERVAYYYHRNLGASIPRSEREGVEWHHKRLLAYNDHVLDSVDRGTNPFARKEWKHDTKEVIAEILQKYSQSASMKLTEAVGENIVDVVRGKTAMLEPMLQDNKLNNFYEQGEAFPRYTTYLATFAKQIGHRFPHMNVLEIGAGTGGATKCFMRDVEDQFATYTFTDISSGFFEKASDLFSAQRSKMSFKVLDIEKEIEGQGFAEGAYDVIVASLVLHATRNLVQTMQNVRKLLKPGGYLLLLEITENRQMQFGLMFGGLPGWWLGCDEGRTLSPCISLEEWDALLKQTGFSGISTAVPHPEEIPVPLSVMVSQAVDDKIDFLEQPLNNAFSESNMIPRLTIVGGGPKSMSLASEIRNILSSRCGDIKFIESLQEIRESDLAVGGSVLCLADLDGPALASIDADTLRGFQSIFKQSNNVLWVTRGARAGLPYSRMAIGFGRTIVLEMLHLRLQFLDLDPGTIASSATISEVFVRFQVAGSWEEVGDDSNLLLNTVEPELCLTPEGKMLVARVKPIVSMNNRCKAARGTVKEHVDPARSTVELSYQKQSNTYELTEADAYEAFQVQGWTTQENTVEVNTLYSMNQPVRIAGDVSLFPLVGKNKTTGEHVIALAPKSASSVKIPKSFFIHGMKISEDEGAEVLQSFYMGLLARASLPDLSPDTRVILVEASDSFAASVDRLVNDKGSSMICLSSNADTKWMYVQPNTPRLVIRHLIELNTDAADTEYCILDMSDDHKIAAIIADLLPSERCRKVAKADVVGSAALLPKRDCRPDIRASLTDAKYALAHRRMAQDHGETDGPELRVVDLADLISDNSDATTTSSEFVISWKSMPSAVPVSVKSIDAKVRFQSDKTYLLVGLTGNLGLSLCSWMVKQGARYLAVASRNPKLEGGFIRKMKAKGVTLEVAAIDVVDRESVRAAHQKIVKTMPPIAGVCHGAMVLHDTIFSELDVERVDKVMKPKIQGSLHLEEIFHDTQLDFFVFFSSIACVVGNPGQSAYAAANMVMSSLAAERRRRNLNASAVHIGAIFGNGYVTRELSLAQQQYLRRVGNHWLSEQDFHALFAEAVYAGIVERGKYHEFSTGLMTIEDNDDFRKNVTWFNNPMFQHCKRPAQSFESAANSGKGRRGVQVKAQLEDAISPDDVRDIIHNAFSAKLQSSLQIEEDRAIGDLTADNLGIDSLVAVDIRSWFIKELQVEIPVLKILGGATVGDIVDRAQQLLPKELTPKLNPEAKGLTKPVEKPTEIAKQPNKTADPKDVPSGKTPEAPKSKSNTPTAPQIGKNVAQRGLSLKDIINSVKVNNAPKVVETLPATPTSLPVSRDETSTRTASLTSSDVMTPGVSDFNSPTSDLSTSWSEIESGSDVGPPKVETERKLCSSYVVKCLDENKALDKAGSKVTKTAAISFAQSRFLFLEQLLESPASALNITVAIDLEGPLNVERFGKAVSTVGQRHEALRTRFSSSKDASEISVQEVLASSCLGLETYDVDDKLLEKQFYRGLEQHKYRLDRGEIMRILLLRRSPTSFRLLIGYHHINMDGVSLEVMIRELQLLYDGRSPGPVKDILQYPDFASKQRQEFQSGLWKNDLDYWKAEFNGQPPPVLPLLPLAKTQIRVPLTAYSTSSAEFHIDKSMMSVVQAACTRLKVSPFHFHLAVFYNLLARLANVEEICIGIASSNRQGPDTMQSMGMYLNLLPLLIKSSVNQTFINTLTLVRAKALAAFSHSEVPFDVIVNTLGVQRTTTHSPVFQAFLNYRPGVSESRKFCDCQSDIKTFKQGEVSYDVGIDIIDNPGGECRVIMCGQSIFYGEREMEQLKNMYLELLKAFSRNPAARTSAPSLYNPDEVKAAIQLGRGAFSTAHWPSTLVHRFDQIAERYKTRTAIQDGMGRSLTYSEMSIRVRSLANSMKSHQSHPIGVGSRVGVCLDADSDWICSLMAILRLGATYIPLDLIAGKDRMSAIVQNSKPDLVLVNARTENDAQDCIQAQQLLNVDAVATDPYAAAVANAAEPGLVATILYTSGSTGVPKGIMIKHESISINTEFFTKTVGYREGQEITLQQSSFNFDMSLSQIFLAISNGGTTHIAPKEMRRDPRAIASIIAEHGITLTCSTPTEAVGWIQHASPGKLEGSSWTKIVCGGEPLMDSLYKNLQQLDKPDLKLIEGYGPTETTFCCATRDRDYRALSSPGEALSKGLGLCIFPNYTLYILDANKKPVPAGISGEVVIGGVGIVDGYVQSELNARAFGNDTWAPEDFTRNGWNRVHYTGDYGKVSPVDGSLILGGRISGDTQIKLRGMRIDVSEIELAILRAAKGEFSEVLVTVRESEVTGATSLIAFAIPSSPDHYKTCGDFASLLDRLPLPLYMRPAAIFCLENLPMNNSGKVDRRALKTIPVPQVQTVMDDTQFTTTEARLLKIWTQVISQEVLSQYQILRESNFFHVGGSSILLVQLRAEVEKVFDITISLFQLFEASTLAAISALIDKASAGTGQGERLESQVIGAAADNIPQVNQIDWDKETAIPANLLPERPRARTTFGNPAVIVLTGSTGFLGQAILKRLLNDNVVQKVHCIAVRDKNRVEDNDIFRSSNKVVVHYGDLTAPHFGLSETTLSNIFSEADALIHNGADVSFLKTYETLKPINVDATKELVRLSLTNQLSFHYVSTASIVQVTGKESWAPLSVKDYPPPSTANGYLATKWASERYLEKVADQYDLRVWIHRPSSITGDGAPAEDLVSNLLKYAEKVKAVPDMGLWKGWLDFVSDETTAMQIVDEVYEDCSWPGHVRYFYQSGEEMIPLSNLRGFLGNKIGGNVDVLPMNDWLTIAERQGMNAMLCEYMRTVADRPLTLTMLEKESMWL